MPSCDALLESLIDQTAVQSDIVSTMNYPDAKASNRDFLENAVADFLNKCGKPAPSCGTCESFFPFAKKPTVATGIALYRNMTAAELKKALRDKGLPVSGSKAVLIERLLESETKRLPRRAKGPLAFEWGETIQVQRSEGIPEIYLEIPTEAEFRKMPKFAQPRVRANIKRALQIRDAAKQGMTHQEYMAREAAARATVREARRKERETKAEETRRKQSPPRPQVGYRDYEYIEGESLFPTGPRKPTREEKLQVKRGVKARAPPEPTTEEKGGKQLPKPGQTMKPIWWQGKLIDVGTGQETTWQKWHLEHGGKSDE
tara:strand:+ start:1597 stop:2544 length:948 start_codon:yes stop_codon:yes gene_type:complete